MDGVLMDGTIEIKDTVIVDLRETKYPYIRRYGVALTNEEAQYYYDAGFRVFGDENGPYLVIRLPRDAKWPFVVNKDHVDVTFAPRRWAVGVGGNNPVTGIICWHERAL